MLAFWRLAFRVFITCSLFRLLIVRFFLFLFYELWFIILNSTFLLTIPCKSLVTYYFQVKAFKYKAYMVSSRLMNVESNIRKRGVKWLPVKRIMRQRASLPHPIECSTLAVSGLSFRVRNGTGRLTWAMTTANLIITLTSSEWQVGGLGTGHEREQKLFYQPIVKQNIQYSLTLEEKYSQKLTLPTHKKAEKNVTITH